MSKPPPLQHGVTYHILARGNNRENIFIGADNYRYFMDKYVEHVVPMADTYAYCLLKNHFHLLVRIKTEEELLKTPSVLHANKTPSVFVAPRDSMSNVVEKHLGSHISRATPSQTFANFLNAYAKAINQLYGRTGSLFQHPFGRIAVTTDNYLLNLIYYIHRNPQKHGFVSDFREYPYSSYPILASEKPTRLQRAQVIKWFNGREQFQAFHAARQDEKIILPLIGEDED